MSDTGPDNLVLSLLRHIRGKVDQHSADFIEVKERLGLLQGSVASIFRRLDRVAGDLDDVKRRLEIADAPR
ncbi:MAG: hypothetical protein RQ966_01440 [Acetobacteraceae bacterium]|nr:hypothetical protein [Acetobacteraceae bacterium]